MRKDDDCERQSVFKETDEDDSMEDMFTDYEAEDGRRRNRYGGVEKIT